MAVAADVFFAQKLADNEETIRNRALKRLRKWLQNRTEQNRHLSLEEAMRLWKGLFYCMWMSDKPLIQEKLADDLGGLVSCFKDRRSELCFVEAFFATFAREWNGIDGLRLDKFSMLIRRFLRSCFESFLRSDRDEIRVEPFAAVLRKTVAAGSTTDVDVPLGFQMHMADIYVEELSRMGNAKISPEMANAFLEPYCLMLAETSSDVLMDRIAERVFEFVMRICSFESPEAEETEASGEEPGVRKKRKKKEGPVSYNRLLATQVRKAMEIPNLRFDYDLLADRLFYLGGRKRIGRRNRSILYRLHKQFRALAKGDFPLDKIKCRFRGERLRPSDYEDATQTLLDAYETDANPRKNRTKGRQAITISTKQKRPTTKANKSIRTIAKGRGRPTFKRKAASKSRNLSDVLRRKGKV